MWFLKSKYPVYRCGLLNTLASQIPAQQFNGVHDVYQLEIISASEKVSEADCIYRPLTCCTMSIQSITSPSYQHHANVTRCMKSSC